MNSVLLACAAGLLCARHGASAQPAVDGLAASGDRRVDPALGTRTPQGIVTKRLADRGLIAVHIYADADACDGIVRALTAQQSAVLCRVAQVAGDTMLVVETTAKNARRLATLPGVRWVEQAPEPTVRNGSLRLIVQTGSALVDPAAAPFDLAGLTGAGQIVGVIDDPLDWDHCAFDDTTPIGPAHRKIIAYNAPLAGVSAHGTHVCGTLAGDSDAHADLRGVARGARIAFDTIPAFDEGTLFEQLERHAQQGARIHSNSWGDEQSTAYGGLARAIDAFCWMNDEHLVVIAAANQGTLKTPENAKNAIAVSATLDAPFQNRFCVGPTGPTADGRRKPDLVAPGCSIFSAYPFGPGCPTAFRSGTSMATPAVAGAAAIARQYFIDGWYPSGEPIASNAFTPSGALLKAVLIAGAADLTEEPGWPGPREGWGRVRLDACLPIGFDDPGRLVIDQAWNSTGDATTDPTPDPTTGPLHDGEVRTVLFQTDGTQPIRVVLAWHDAPGAFGALDPVINNLDLTVIAPDGTAYRGNDIDAQTGESVPAQFSSSAADARNASEVVALGTPLPGVYTVRIDGANVPVGRQGYGLAIVGPVGPAAVAGCGAADLAPPQGVLDLADINAFLALFSTADPGADLRADGVFDLGDINAFVAAFAAGCP